MPDRISEPHRASNADGQSPSNGVQRSVVDLMMTHRSVRAFTDELVPGAVVRELITAGTRASTSSNMQAYSVISITDVAVKSRLATLCGDQQQIHQSGAFLVFCADMHKLSLACQMHDVATAAPGEVEALLVSVVDTALVMQNVALAAESLGYGICMIGAMRNDSAAVGDALHLPKHVFALSGMCIGRPSEAGEVKPRLGLEATLHENRYRADADMVPLLAVYDDVQAEWYALRDMHPGDPRWTSVMSRRLPTVEKRRNVEVFLKAQGFLSR